MLISRTLGVICGLAKCRLTENLLALNFHFLVARRKVIAQLKSNNEVTRTVSNRVGPLWKRLARQLDLREGQIDTILEEENDDQERCFKALVKWCQLNGEGATIRKLMLALTKTGLAEVNNDVMRCLHLLL